MRFKRLLSLALCILFAALTTPVCRANGDTLGGDINGDDAVNNKDLTRLFQYLSEWDVAVNEAVLDVNGDSLVDNKDLTRLFRYLSGWEVEILPTTVCNHAAAEWVVTKPANKNEDGEKALICSRCGRTVDTEIIPKLKEPTKLEQLEQGMLGLINQARAEEGLSPLTFDYERQAATDIRVQEITELFSHTRPNGKACFTVLDEVGFSSFVTAGENIAYFGYYGEDSDTTYGYTKLHDMFMNSSGHRANVLNGDFKRVSLSFTIKNNCLYVVQMFFG